MKLQPYEFEIQYCAGELHGNVDAMSWLPTMPADVEVVCVLVELWALCPWRVAAVRGREFICRVTTDLYGD